MRRQPDVYDITDRDVGSEPGWWGDDDALPDGMDEDEKWACIRATALPAHRAVAIAAEHPFDSEESTAESAVDALLASVLPAEKATITVPEAGKVLGHGEASSYAAARRGDLPVLRFGHRVVVPVPALRDLLENPPKEPGDHDGRASGPRRVKPSSLRDPRGPIRVISQ